MANFNDRWAGNTASSSTALASSDHSWIHDLARGEQNPEADRLMRAAAGGLDPQQRIEEATIDYLTALREQFSEHCRLFNGYSEAGSRFQEVKVYSVAQTAADFMIYRNQIKLIVSNTSHGMIQFSFSQHQAPGAAPQDSRGHELLAQVGPFGDVSWTFQGEKVTPFQVARFYFTEFVRATRDHRKSKSGGQQLLLEQIKALLQEQGLSL